MSSSGPWCGEGGGSPRTQDQLDCVPLGEGGMSTTAMSTGAQPLSHTPRLNSPDLRSSENQKALIKFSADSFSSGTCLKPVKVFISLTVPLSVSAPDSLQGH